MSVDCDIKIPSDARAKDITVVMGIAAGCKVTKCELDKPGYFYLKVDGCENLACESPYLITCSDIKITCRTIDGLLGHHVMLHSEYEHGLWKLLSPMSTPFWIAVGQKVVDFFGGSIDYNDCDSSKDDYVRAKPRKWNDPEDDRPWQQFHKDMLKIKPVTMADMIRVNHFAAYMGAGIDRSVKFIGGNPKGKSKGNAIDNKTMEIILDRMEDIHDR